MKRKKSHLNPVRVEKEMFPFILISINLVKHLVQCLFIKHFKTLPRAAQRSETTPCTVSFPRRLTSGKGALQGTNAISKESMSVNIYCVKEATIYKIKIENPERLILTEPRSDNISSIKTS